VFDGAAIVNMIFPQIHPMTKAMLKTKNHNKKSG